MLQLTAPISLLAAAGILIPVLIHLWNTRRGQVRKVGSIQLLKESARSQARSLRLTDRWLLLLRCLILCVLALLLARPVWIEPSRAKGWILIEPRSIDRLYPAYQSLIDSLLGEGYEGRSFDTAFSPLDLQKLRNEKGTDSSGRASSYWSLLTMLDERVDKALPLYLFTGRELHRFEGRRPEVALNLQWHTIESTDSSSFPVSLRRTTGDSLLLTYRHATPRESYITTETRDERSLESDASFSLEQVAVDTSRIRVLVYADKSGDARYVTAALEAIRKSARLPIEITAASQAGALRDADWLFWLSEQPLPKTTGIRHIFLYQAGTIRQESTWMAGYAADGGVHFARTVSGADTNGRHPLWTDGTGTPLLTRTGSDPVRYHFRSRLRPDWNDLVWHEAFAERLYQLLAPNGLPAVRDHRNIDAEQILPAMREEKKRSALQASVTQHLDLPLWLAALVLFALERYFSHRPKKGGAYGT